MKPLEWSCHIARIRRWRCPNSSRCPDSFVTIRDAANMAERVQGNREICSLPAMLPAPSMRLRRTDSCCPAFVLRHGSETAPRSTSFVSHPPARCTSGRAYATANGTGPAATSGTGRRAAVRREAAEFHPRPRASPLGEPAPEPVWMISAPSAGRCDTTQHAPAARRPRTVQASVPARGRSPIQNRPPWRAITYRGFEHGGVRTQTSIAARALTVPVAIRRNRAGVCAVP